jgi:hypothetical protein
MANALTDLPALQKRLRVALVPANCTGERITSPRGEAPMPARLAALTLEAGGSDDARCLFVPGVRVWTTVEPGPVDSDGGLGRPALCWHREPIHDAQGKPVMVLADDQAGVLPIREWLRAWALEWRHAFGHNTARRGSDARRHPQPEPPALTAEQRRALAMARLGIAPARQPADRPDDPTAQEWQLRWPSDSAGWGPATRHHFSYLYTWLEEACDTQQHIGDFAASLRSLTGAVRAALDDRDDLEYLGRCPDEITNRASGAVAVCGAPLWHDPYASVITCPRCHTETSHDRRVWLARRILDTWPIDPRRRYPRGLIKVLRIPPCARCGKPTAVEWIEATERADRERFWRPGKLTCSAGCEAFT